MEPADIMKIDMSVEEAKKLLAEGTRERVIADNIATSIRGHKFTPAQAQAALILAWNDLLGRVQFSFRDLDAGEDSTPD